MNMIVTEETTTFLKIYKEIGLWAQANFGEQVSKRTGAKLNSLCPLMGIGEELTDELLQAIVLKDSEQVLDAIADITIFVCDYSFRESVIPQLDPAKYLPEGPRRTAYLEQVSFDLKGSNYPYDRMLINYGRLLHVNLKSHQGIRGYDNFELYDIERTTYLDCFMDALQDFTKQYADANDADHTLLEILQTVWKRVSKRSWVSNSTTGNPEDDIHPAEVCKTPPTVNDNAQFNNE